MFKKEIAGLLLLLSAASSHAAFGSEPGASASVTSDVVSNGSTWTYSYTLTNTDTCIGNCETTAGGKSILGYWLADRIFAVPYFGDAQIIDITDPQGWSHFITGDGPFSALGAGTLGWYATSDQYRLALSESLSGFGFTAEFAPGAAPFFVESGMTEMLGEPDVFYGSLSLPMSPNAIEALTTAVPEPSTYGMMLLGTVAVAVASRRRKRAAANAA